MLGPKDRCDDVDTTSTDAVYGQHAPAPTDDRVPPDAMPAGLLQQPPMVVGAPAPCLCLVGDALELLMAPGDLLIVQGSGRLSQIGTAGGFMGHVLLVLAPPVNVWRHSEEAHELREVWPSGNVEELWRVRTLESTRAEVGLNEAVMLVFVDKVTGRLTLAGEETLDGTICLTEREVVELWQSPCSLRRCLRVDLMAEALEDMRDPDASWSTATAVRAVFKSARLVGKADDAKMMEKLQEYWKQPPICTSVPIVFWQRYLHKLALHSATDPVALILKWMPLKADRGLPGDLVSVLREVGWASLPTVPRVFRTLAVPPPIPQLVPSRRPSVSPEKQRPRESSVDDTSQQSTAEDTSQAQSAASEEAPALQL